MRVTGGAGLTRPLPAAAYSITVSERSSAFPEPSARRLFPTGGLHQGGQQMPKIIAHRVLVPLILAGALSACGMVAERQRQAEYEAALQRYQTANDACAKFSEAREHAIARARCFNDADLAFMPFDQTPDLRHLLIARRTEIAERRAAGKITFAQAQVEMSELATSLTAEHQRRLNANASVAAQEQAAAAATLSAIKQGAPRRCTAVGNTVSCF